MQSITDNDKKQFLRNSNLATIEIDLSSYLEMNIEDFNIEEFKYELLHSNEYKSWLVIKDEKKKVLEAERLLNEKYTRLKEATLNKLKEDMKQKVIQAEEDMRKKLIEDSKHKELLKYHNDKIELFYMKKYKEIENRYFIKKDKEKYIQNLIINKMSGSGRFHESYIEKFIPAANLYFNCKFKTWQSIIFYKFIISEDIGSVFTINEIISYFEQSEKTKEYFDRKFYSIASKQDIKKLKQIISAYLDYLRDIGIIRGEVATDWYSYYDLQFRVIR